MSILSWLPARAEGTTLLINNGLAPPNPANVIDFNDPTLFVYVRDVGCDLSEGLDSCDEAGTSTTAALVDGASVVDLLVLDSSRGFVEGGLGFDIAGLQSGYIFLTGGSFSGELITLDQSSAVVAGGEVAEMRAANSSNITMTDGLVSVVLQAGHTASIDVYGGAVEGLVAASESGTVQIFGTGFTVDGAPVQAGPIAATSGLLAGMLALGDPIETEFWHAGFDGFTGTIVLVETPEPTSSALVSMGLLILAAGRRLRSS